MNSKEVKHREFYQLANIRQVAKTKGISYQNKSKQKLCGEVGIPFKTLKEMNKIPSSVPRKEKHEIYNYKYHQTKNLMVVASIQGVKNPNQYNKKELCKITGIKYKKTERKVYPHYLTNIETGEIQKFKSARSLGLNLNSTTRIILYKARNGQPLVVNEVGYIVKKID